MSPPRLVFPQDWPSQPRVLVVDDSPDDLRLLFEMMSAQDINVEVAFLAQGRVLL